MPNKDRQLSECTSLALQPYRRKEIGNHLRCIVDLMDLGADFMAINSSSNHFDPTCAQYHARMSVANRDRIRTGKLNIIPEETAIGNDSNITARGNDKLY